MRIRINLTLIDRINLTLIEMIRETTNRDYRVINHNARLITTRFSALQKGTQ